jgi:hypothetical protein
MASACDDGVVRVNIGPFSFSAAGLINAFMTLCTGGLWLLVWRPWRRR